RRRAPEAEPGGCRQSRAETAVRPGRDQAEGALGGDNIDACARQRRECRDREIIGRESARVDERMFDAGVACTLQRTAWTISDHQRDACTAVTLAVECVDQ